MSQVKPTAIVTIRRYLHRLGAEAEATFLSRLSPETAEVYRRIETVTCITHAQDEEFLEAAARTLYGEAPDRLERLGAQIAKLEFPEIFHSSLILPTLTLLFKQVFHRVRSEPSAEPLEDSSPLAFFIYHLPELWRNFYESGELKVEDLTPVSALVRLCGLPDVPRGPRLVMAGFVAQLLTQAGAKHLKVEVLEDDPQAWKFPITWE